MNSARDPLVTVCRDPRDHQRARVHLSALSAFAFDAFTDGIRSRFMRPMLTASMAPTDIVDGAIRRPASHGLVPDRMKVAITRLHNATTYPTMERIAAARRIAELAPVPRQRVRLNAPAIPSRPVASVVPVAPPSPAVPVTSVAPTAPRASVTRPRAETAPARCSRAIDVAAIRARSGMSAAAFAARIGVSRATVHLWESGQSAPCAANREFLAQIDRDGVHPAAT